MQGREKRPGFDRERTFRNLRYAIGDAQPMQRPETERLQHQKIERALQKIVLLSLQFITPIDNLYEIDTTCSYRMSIGAPLSTSES